MLFSCLWSKPGKWYVRQKRTLVILIYSVFVSCPIYTLINIVHFITQRRIDSLVQSYQFHLDICIIVNIYAVMLVTFRLYLLAFNDISNPDKYSYWSPFPKYWPVHTINLELFSTEDSKINNDSQFNLELLMILSSYLACILYEVLQI